jgi:putative alpha-1,2-mannosidase
VREVKETTFGDITPYGGYNGDEDQGQLGALGVLMAIGLFQMDGGASIHSSYEITTPIFDTIEIQLNPKYYSGKKFVISAENNSKDNIYIQQAKLNGQNWMRYSFSHEIFSKGGELKLILGKEPNRKWGQQ